MEIITAASAGLAVGMVNALLPSIARKTGMEPLGLSALAATPFLANVLGLLGGRMPISDPVGMAVLRAAGTFVLVFLPIAPLPVWVVLVLLFWLVVALISPLQVRMWGLLYPANQRNRLTGIVRTGQAASVALVAVAGGLLADRLGGPQVVAGAAFLSALGVLVYSTLRRPPGREQPHRQYGAREAIRALTTHPRVSTLAVAQGVFGAGLISAAPLYPLAQVDRLHLSLAQIGVLGILTALTTTALYVTWGTLADRRGPTTVLTLGATLGMFVPLIYVIAPNFEVLCVAAIAAGLSNAAMDTGTTAAISVDTPLDDRPPLMAAWSGLTGMRGMIVPFISGALVQTHLLSVEATLLGCAGVAGAGIALYARVWWRSRRQPLRRPVSGRFPH